MIHPTPHEAQEAYSTLLEERNSIASKLRLPDTFRTPQQRSEAAARLKVLNQTLNRMYNERNAS